MVMNFNFAKLHGLPVDTNYSVSPHHSGIYPVYKELYEEWSNVWSIKATSTIMYPHGRPVHMKRGFQFNGIMVAPRHSIGVYTHTLHFQSYPGGTQALFNTIKGGDVFDTVVFGDVIIFMTHMANFANDRLANFILGNLFEFLNCWTNLKFYALPPQTLVEKYFEIHQEEVQPLWTVSSFCMGFLFCFFPDFLNFCVSRIHAMIQNIWLLLRQTTRTLVVEFRNSLLLVHNVVAQQHCLHS
jgi:heparan sulfate N-deacetylase/N-sulfotransferase NDST2